MKKWLKHGLVVGYLLGGPGLGLALTIAYGSDFLSVFDSYSSLISSAILMVLGGALVGIALMPSFLLGAIIGYTLPIIYAYPAAIFGIFIATAIGIFLSERIGDDIMDDVLAIRPKWQDAYKKITAAPPNLVLPLLASLRIAPQMPFALTNFICAFWPLPKTKLIFWSGLGLLPRTLLAVVAGAGASRFEELTSKGASPTEWAIGFAILIVFIATLAWAKKQVKAL